jgi:hypothetical protein
MINPFKDSIPIYEPGNVYQMKQKVIYNFQVYISLINNNNLLPSTGDPNIDSFMAQTYGITVGNTWSKL